MSPYTFVCAVHAAHQPRCDSITLANLDSGSLLAQAQTLQLWQKVAMALVAALCLVVPAFVALIDLTSFACIDGDGIEKDTGGQCLESRV